MNNPPLTNWLMKWFAAFLTEPPFPSGSIGCLGGGKSPFFFSLSLFYEVKRIEKGSDFRVKSVFAYFSVPYMKENVKRLPCRLCGGLKRL